jgi:hypothetical protein
MSTSLVGVGMFPAKIQSGEEAMKQFKTVVSVFVTAGVLLAGVSAFADDNKNLNKAKNTVNNVRQADPPKASNTPKASPVGQPVTSTSKQAGYKPAQKSPESKKIVVPPPSK